MVALVRRGIIGEMFEIKETKLKSGLRVFMIPLPTESVTLLTMIKAGSKDEFEGKWGVAHFLEHFVFKGTRKYPKVNDVTKVIDGIGGKQNAFTWTDFTGFWVKVGKNQVEQGLDVLSQMVCEPLLPEKELKKEAGTIIQEIKMGEDSYPRKAYEVFADLVFPESSIGRPVIGFEETVAGVKREDLIAFRERWYAPKNMAIVIAGNFTQVRNLETMLEEKFRTLNGEKMTKDRVEEKQVFTQDCPRVKIVKRKTEQVHLVLGMRTFGVNDERNYALWVMNQILGGNMSSRLWNEVREKRGLAYYVGSSFYSHEKTGVLMARAGVKTDKALEAVRVIKNEFEKLAKKKVTREELVMGIEGVKGNLRLDLEDSHEVAELVAEDWVMRGQTRTVEEIIKKVNEVDAEIIRQVAEEIIEKNQFNLSLVGPIKAKSGFVRVLEE